MKIFTVTFIEAFTQAWYLKSELQEIAKQGFFSEMWYVIVYGGFFVIFLAFIVFLFLCCHLAEYRCLYNLSHFYSCHLWLYVKEKLSAFFIKIWQI